MGKQKNRKSVDQPEQTRKTKKRRKSRRPKVNTRAQDEFLDLMTGRVPHARPRYKAYYAPSKEQLRRQAVRRERAKAAEERARAITQGEQQAEQAWQETFERKGRKVSKRTSRTRSETRRLREELLAQGNEQAQAAWDAQYGKDS